MATYGNGRRVAIIAGVRTPFARAGTALRTVSAIELGKACVAELVQRTNLDGKEVDALVFGTVVPSVQAPNSRPGASEPVRSASRPATIGPPACPTAKNVASSPSAAGASVGPTSSVHALVIAAGKPHIEIP